MGFLLSIFTSKFTWIFLAIAGIAIFMGVQQGRISHLKSVVADRDAAIAAQKASLDANKILIGQWDAAYKTLAATVVTQNNAINKLEAEVAARMAKAKEAIRLADIERKKADGLANSIQMMEVAKDECTAMRQLIDAYVGGVR
jgi:hypothetical protein